MIRFQNPERLTLAAFAAIAVLWLAAEASAFTPQPGFQLDLKEAPGRFEVLEEFDDEAVLDTRTGLIWEKTPEDQLGYWWISVSSCIKSTTGGRYGWRLPTIDELSSLMEVHDYGRLPFDHPFKVDTSLPFWTQTGNPDYNRLAFTVEFGTWTPIESRNKNQQLYRWCVRSPHPGSQFYASND